MTRPPDNLPIYRLLMGNDDAAFCRKVSDALASGYELHGSPAMITDMHQLVVTQAVFGRVLESLSPSAWLLWNGRLVSNHRVAYSQSDVTDCIANL